MPLLPLVYTSFSYLCSYLQRSCVNEPRISTHQVVYLNHGTLSANSLSNNFCSSVNSLAPISAAILSLLLFSLAHHVDINSVKPNAILHTH
jgi:hypothetical protein